MIVILKKFLLDSNQNIWTINAEESFVLINKNNGNKIKERALFFHFPIYLEPYNVHKDDGTDPLFRTRPGSVVIKDNWKLHHYFEDNKIELYDIIKDKSESKNLSKINTKKTKELYGDLERWRKENNAPIPSLKNPYYNQKYVDSLNFLIMNKKIMGKVNKNEKIDDKNPF